MTQEALAQRLMKVRGEKGKGKLDSYRVLISRTESYKRVGTIDDLVDFADALELPAISILLTEASDLTPAEMRDQAEAIFADLRERLEAYDRLIREAGEEDQQ